jgi:hypothetical protein
MSVFPGNLTQKPTQILILETMEADIQNIFEKKKTLFKHECRGPGPNRFSGSFKVVTMGRKYQKSIDCCGHVALSTCRASSFESPGSEHIKTHLFAIKDHPTSALPPPYYHNVSVKAEHCPFSPLVPCPLHLPPRQPTRRAS